MYLIGKKNAKKTRGVGYNWENERPMRPNRYNLLYISILLRTLPVQSSVLFAIRASFLHFERPKKKGRIGRW